ncbi:MAG TPA: type II toxin-antitoxin system RelE/ParE family toxin [Thermoanaerobaculia bacterium]|nr:type II toxin-antitoxin system RelE/ParE family toxin [Thermoanaerobaculia bacterium]
MKLEVNWLPRARRDLKRLDRQTQARVVDAVERFAAFGQGDVLHLVDVKPPEYRLRIGDWRLRFSRDEERQVLHVLRVLPRGKAYR